MEIEKLDRRVAKTRTLLVNTMLELLRTKSFAKITINDICEAAMVSRSTFYAHFEDKFCLLNTAIDEITKRLNRETETANIPNRPHAIFATVYKESKLFKNIFVNDQSEELQKYFFDHCYKDLLVLLQDQKKNGRIFSEKEEIIASFYAGGISALLKWWIVSGFPVSVDEISRSQNNMMASLLFEM